MERIRIRDGVNVLRVDNGGGLVSLYFETAPGNGLLIGQLGRIEMDEAFEVIPDDEPAAPVLTRPYMEIMAERKRQDEQWGGPSHDDRHTVNDWLSFILKQVAGAMRFWTSSKQLRDRELFRSGVADRAFVKIGALCVAALESIDRRNFPGDWGTKE